MPFTNYHTVILRTSAATSGANEQDTAVVLPENVNALFVVVQKTVEPNADNLMTVRLQASVGGSWFDLSWDWNQLSTAVTVAGDTATDVTRTPNITDADSTAPTYQHLAYYSNLPSKTVRIISINSGTGAANTFGSVGAYSDYKL